MQRKLLAAALFATLPLAASAQSSVVVYGVADLAVAKEDTGAPGGRRTAVNSGNQSSSRLGFRGTEDLGNGMKALFNIEAGVSMDTGAADASFWGRRAVVGLQGNFGTVTVGREYSPIADIAKEADVFGQGFYGSNLNAFGTNRLTRRLSNSVNYKSPVFSGFKVSAAYSAGEQASNAPASADLLGLGVEFNYAGFYAGAGYHQFERVAASDDKEMILGGGYKMGSWDFKLMYAEADPSGANNEFEQMQAGVAYTMGANKFFFNYQQNELETGAKGNGWALAYTYSLSKRTNLYASYSTVRNNSRANFGMNSSSTNITPPATALGADPKALVLGVRHQF
jgi:predicted porin